MPLAAKPDQELNIKRIAYREKVNSYSHHSSLTPRPSVRDSRCFHIPFLFALFQCLSISSSEESWMSFPSFFSSDSM